MHLIRIWRLKWWVNNAVYEIQICGVVFRHVALEDVRFNREVTLLDDIISKVILKFMAIINFYQLGSVYGRNNIAYDVCLLKI